ncbi:hypothetical protein U9M48_025671, partial [Paspalum notatum var. saurae]
YSIPEPTHRTTLSNQAPSPPHPRRPTARASPLSHDSPLHPRPRHRLLSRFLRRRILPDRARRSAPGFGGGLGTPQPRAAAPSPHRRHQLELAAGSPQHSVCEICSNSSVVAVPAPPLIDLPCTHGFTDGSIHNIWFD